MVNNAAASMQSYPDPARYLDSAFTYQNPQKLGTRSIVLGLRSGSRAEAEAVTCTEEARDLD